MKQSLQLKVSQQLTLTPQLQQSLKMLQLSSLDLEQEVQQALEDNPLLEDASQDEDGESGTAEMNNVDGELEVSDDGGDTLNFTSDQFALEGGQAESQWDEQFEDRRAPTTIGNPDQSEVDSTANATIQESLFSHLYWQVRMTHLGERDLLIARAILRNLDEEGYLQITPEQLQPNFDPQLDVECDEIEAILNLVKTLEPIGVGAQDLQERLIIQLNHSHRDADGFADADRLLRECFTLLGKRNHNEIRRLLGITENRLSTAIQLITQLTPRIAAQFSQVTSNQILPDVIVKNTSAGWRASINPNNQHKLRVNQEYQALLSAELDKQSSEYIKQKTVDAKQFIKSLMSRYDTLLLVAQHIVDRQVDFFNSGDTAMTVLTLGDIATELDMHESTISRATAGKYLLSPRGVFELKYFFSSGVTASDGSTTSSVVIRSLIKAMIGKEEKRKPLSDNKIADELAQQGHKVARRTVAKYRESLNIAPSSQRKQI
ncbi:MAG: RNA polymerase factor sigma-54 [Pseudomonadota bacterium]